MNKKSTKTSCFLFILIISLTLSSLPRIVYPASKKEKQETTEYIEIWHSFSQSKKELLNNQIENLNRLNEGIKAKSIFKGNPEDLYLDLLARDKLPSIAIIPTFYLSTLAEKDLIIDLSSYIPSKLKKDISEKFWQSVTLGNRVYGLPFIYSLPVFYINQNLTQSRGISFTKEPENWTQIFTVLKRIKETTDKYGFYIPTNSLYNFIEYIESYTDTKIYYEDKIELLSTVTIEAIKTLQNAIYKYNYMPEKLTSEEAQNLFLSGKLAILLSDASNLINIKSMIPYILGVWPLPFGKNTRPLMFGTCFVIINSTKAHENKSFRVIEYLTNYENALKWHTHTGAPPIRNSIKESLDLLLFYEENPNHLVITNYAKSADIFNPRFDYIEYNRIIKNAMQEIIINEKPPSLIMKNAQLELEALGK